VNKYDYTVEITHDNLLYEESLSIEIYLISFWRENSKILLCNITDGGEGTLGYKFSNESKNKISKSQKLRLSNKINHPLFGKKHTKESIEKNRESNKGEKSFLYNKRGNLHPRYGKSISDEQKNIIVNTNKKRAKLKDNHIDEIIKLYEPRKVTLTEISKKYNVSVSSISKVIKKRQNEIYNGRETSNTKVCMERVG
jgi:group I intron endonuclease